MAAGRWSDHFAIGAVVERNNYLASEPVGIPIELQLTLELGHDPADNSSAEALATGRRWNLCRGPLIFLIRIKEQEMSRDFHR